jgi:hypothetical protein
MKNYKDKNKLMRIITDNQDNNAVLSDFCTYLLADINFCCLSTEKKQLEYIKKLPMIHGCHLIIPIKELLKIYNE